MASNKHNNITGTGSATCALKAASDNVDNTVGVRPSLKPMFKWTGGKRKEIRLFEPYLPEFVLSGQPYRYVEPFVGAGALFWHLNNTNSHINDFDADVVNLYEQVASGNPALLKRVAATEQLFDTGTRDDIASDYYSLRNLDRTPGLDQLDPGLRAARFFIVNQLAFSGMRRFNSDGKFNVAFGHYKSFNAASIRSNDHAELLRSATITAGDYGATLAANDQPDTFIFCDPPYTRVMKTYSAGNEFGEAEQRKLAERLTSMQHASWMIVIDKSDLTVKLYGDYIKSTYDLSYSVNIRNRFDQRAEHLVATNYPTAAAAAQVSADELLEAA